MANEMRKTGKCIEYRLVDEHDEVRAKLVTKILFQFNDEPSYRFCVFTEVDGEVENDGLSIYHPCTWLELYHSINMDGGARVRFNEDKGIWV